MKITRKYPKRGGIVIPILALIFTSILCITAAAADDLPVYVESITPGTSVDVVFSSGGGDPQVITSTSPSLIAAETAKTHSSEAYNNYYLSYYLTPGFVGAPLIGEYRSQSGGFPQSIIANYGLRAIQPVGGSAGIPKAGDLIANKKMHGDMIL
jgi:hypothetical protein